MWAAAAQALDKHPPAASECTDVAVRAEATGHDDLRIRGLGARQQSRHGLRWVLQVTVHDAHPGPPSHPDARDDGSAEAAFALAVDTVQQPDVARRRPADGEDRLGRSVVAVVDDDDLHRHVGQDVLERGNERHDIGLLVASRHDDGQQRAAAVRRPAFVCHAGARLRLAALGPSLCGD